MSACCHIVRSETACPNPVVVDPQKGTVTDVVTLPPGGSSVTGVTSPTGGTVTLPPPVISGDKQGFWFQCAYSGCHNGVGFVRIYNGADRIMYHGCPYTSGTSKVFIPVDFSLLTYGTRIHVDYVNRGGSRGGYASPCGGGHGCNSARFNVGLGNDLIGVADMDNSGKNNSNDGSSGSERYNKFIIPNSIIDNFKNAMAPSTPAKPATPSGVDVVYIDQSKIVIVWNDMAYDETGYEIERKKGSDSWQGLVVVGSNITVYNDLSPLGGAFGYNQLYSYRIRALGAVTGDWSVERSVTTPAPPTPGAITVVYVNQQQIGLAWDDVFPNEAGFEIEREAGGQWGALATVPANTTKYTDNSPPSGGFGYLTTYNYRLRAIGSDASFPSSYYLGSVTTNAAPTPPGPPVVTYLTQKRIAVTWNDVSSEETGYQVERRVGELGDWELAGSVAANGTIYVDTNPPDGTSFGYDTNYYYRVRPVGLNGYVGIWSAASFASTPAPPDISTRFICFNEYDSCSGVDISTIPKLAWWDASDIPSVTLAAGKVSAWADKSGNGRTLVGGAVAPSIGDSVNLFQTIRFSGANYLSCAISPFGGKGAVILEANIFAVYKMRGLSNGKLFKVDYLSNYTGTDVSKHEFSNIGNTVYYDAGKYSNYPYDGGYSRVSSSVFAAPGDLVIGFFRTSSSANSHEIWKNGGRIAKANASSLRGGNFLRIGEGGDFDIAEIIIVGGVVTDAIKEKVEGYLSKKWGIALVTGHPWR